MPNQSARFLLIAASLLAISVNKPAAAATTAPVNTVSQQNVALQPEETENGTNARAVDPLEAAIEVASNRDSVRGQVGLLGRIAVAYHERGETETAQTLIAQAAEAAMQSTSTSPGYILSELAEYVLEMGDVETATVLLQQSLDLVDASDYIRRDGDVRQIVSVYAQIDDDAIVEPALSQAVDILETLEPIGQSTQYVNGTLAEAYATLSDAEAANAGLARLLPISMSLLGQRDDTPDYARSELHSIDGPRLMSQVAAAHAQQGDFETAESLLIAAVSQMESSDYGLAPYVAQMLPDIAIAHRHLQNTPTARQNLARLTQLVQSTDMRTYDRRNALGAIALAYHGMGDPTGTQQTVELTAGLVTENDSPTEQVSHLLDMADLYLEMDMISEQQRAIQQAFFVVTRTDPNIGLGFSVLGSLGVATTEINDPAIAQQRYRQLDTFLVGTAATLTEYERHSRRLYLARQHDDNDAVRTLLSNLMQDLESDSDMSDSTRASLIGLAAYHYSLFADETYTQEGFQGLRSYAEQLDPAERLNYSGVDVLDEIALTEAGL